MSVRSLAHLLEELAMLRITMALREGLGTRIACKSLRR